LPSLNYTSYTTGSAKTHFVHLVKNATDKKSSPDTSQCKDK